MEEPRWTLDELAERVDAALAVDYHGQPSGRVRDVPDRRAIRWYTTIGLVDRPLAHRGRTALYGPRHLLQLVAVKRLQARGLPLVAIQQELAGATDTDLGRVARLPATAGVGVVPPMGPEAPVASGVGADLPVRPEALAASDINTGSPGSEALAASDADPGPPAATVPARPPGVTGAAARRPAAGPARRAAFWRNPPVAALTAEAAGATDATAGAAAPAVPDAPVHIAGVATLRGVRLAGGVTLLLEPARDLDPADLDAILDAARPLVAVLRDRRLAGMPGPAQASPGPASPIQEPPGPVFAGPEPGPASPEIDLPRRRPADGELRREHP